MMFHPSRGCFEHEQCVCEVYVLKFDVVLHCILQGRACCASLRDKFLAVGPLIILLLHESSSESSLTPREAFE